MRWYFLLLFLPLFLACNEPVYHENGQIACFGSNQSDYKVFYQNGQVAWPGYFKRECLFSYSRCTIFHQNGLKAWKGASYGESKFSNDACTIFHNNREVAWKGALNKDCNYSYNRCSVYHHNRQLAWRGATSAESPYSNEPCTIFHSNGTPAWRGNFAFETTSLHASGVYHDNGVLAWNGKLGSPTYDRKGNIHLPNAQAINMPLGEDSWLYLSHDGVRYLHLSIGDQSFLTFSNQDQNPRLLMHLGQGIHFECFPYTGEMPQISVNQERFPARKTP